MTTNFLMIFLTTMFLGFALIPLITKLKARQTILSYVKEHENKNGTPTMGGLIFILPIAAFFFLEQATKSVTMAFAISLAMGLLGFLDDFSKVKFGKNLGLKPYQKIIFQLVVGLIFSVYVFQNVTRSMLIPFFGNVVDLGIFAIPIYLLIFIATTNSVNLTDGLDGLSTSTTMCCLAFLSFLISSQLAGVAKGWNFQLEEISTLLLLVIFSLAAFLIFNFHPAKIFMGDTGSMFLGGIIATCAIVTGNALFLPFFGIAFVISGISDILQVLYFKKTKGKRIFKMAPFHHHLQQKGLTEEKIVIIYLAVTVVASLGVLAFTI